MGSSSLAIIHCNPAVPWQLKRGNYFAEGLRAAGFKVEFTSDRFRHDEGFPILLGTTFWKDVERDGREFLLVDRCSFGDTNKFVSLVWNGHGRRGDHRTPREVDASRWEIMGMELQPWCHGGSRVVLCGQVETYSPHWQTVDAWYSSVNATAFRKHPSSVNTTHLPDVYDFENTRAAITLNSSIGPWCVIHGIPTITMDEGSMAWDVTGHSLNDIRTDEREPWCHWLAHTQWSDDEIRKGNLWDSQLSRPPQLIQSH